MRVAELELSEGLLKVEDGLVGIRDGRAISLVAARVDEASDGRVKRRGRIGRMGGLTGGRRGEDGVKTVDESGESCGDAWRVRGEELLAEALNTGVRKMNEDVRVDGLT